MRYAVMVVHNIEAISEAKAIEQVASLHSDISSVVDIDVTLLDPPIPTAMEEAFEAIMQGKTEAMRKFAEDNNIPIVTILKWRK